VELEALHTEQIVFETIYAPRSTPLVRAAEACGARVIYGLEMFLDQGIAQFELHTDVKPPRAAMEKALHDASEA
jgi:shikimate 5-dehydrogenase